MTIGSGDGIEKFGTQAAVTNASVSINNGAMSVAGDAIAWTNSDDATDADMLLEATFSAPPSVGSAVAVYSRKLNVRSTNDENTPSLGDNENQYLGEFTLDASATAQISTRRVSLPNGKTAQEYEFYFKNEGGQNITVCQAWITPIAIGPAP